MVTINATEARKDWSLVVDHTIREKPQFIKRTRDRIMLADVNFIQDLLFAYEFSAVSYVEKDGTITLSLNEIDLAENGATEQAARLELGKAILTYAEDFYDDFGYWSTAPNRTRHIPYVFKALIINDEQKLGEMIKCLSGKI